MLPAFLITLREVIEASLIVATILGILVKLKQKSSIKILWYATATAGIVSIILLLLGSILGLKIQEVYSGHTESVIEGILMIVSALFITWAVFFLHNYFGKYKTRLLVKINKAVGKKSQTALFILVFTAVAREGFEIVLFLSTIYLSDNPASILSGFTLGTVLALIISFGLFTAALKLPVFYAFRISSILLILFAAGLLARGVHEFAEVGILPEIGKMTLNFIPDSVTVPGMFIKSIFGITRRMDLAQISLYSIYAGIMFYWVFGRNNEEKDINGE